MRGEGDEAEHSGRVCDGARVCWWCGLSAGASVPASGLSVASAWISGHPPTLSPPHDQDQPWPLLLLHDKVVLGIICQCEH